jgi:ribosome-associated protein
MEKNILKTSVFGALEKKAINIKILDLKKLESFTDYFIIISGTSNKHVQAIADSIKEENKKNNYPLFGEEGYKEAKWILLDYGDVIIHVFDEEVRDFYDIEGLWFEADKIDLESLALEDKA